MTTPSLLLRSARTVAAGFGLGLGLALAAAAAALLTAPPLVAAALVVVFVVALLARSTIVALPARALARVTALLARSTIVTLPARALARVTALQARVAAAFPLGAALAAAAAALLTAPPLVAGHPSAALAAAPAIAALLLALRGRRTARALRERAARVSHEVRGPLAAAHLALHGAARRGEVTPATVATLELELRRATLALEEPALADPQEVDLHALLSLQVRTWHDVAAAHGATLTLVPGIGTALVHADALRIAQATSNVLANAIEHGGGAITIRTVLTGDRVRVEVSDGGPGLPASIAEIIRRPTAGRGTRGRGLAIASTVLAHCGGHLAPLPTGPGVAIDLPLIHPSTADQPA